MKKTEYKNRRRVDETSHSSDQESDDEHFILPQNLQPKAHKYHFYRNDGQVDSFRLMMWVFCFFFALTAFGAVCAFVGSVLLKRIQLDRLDRLPSRRAGSNETGDLNFSRDTTRYYGLQQQVAAIVAALQMERPGGKIRLFQSVDRRLHDTSERVSNLDAVIQTVKSDIFHIQDERTNVRLTVNDLTNKILNDQELLVSMWKQITRLDAALSRLEARHNMTMMASHNEKDVRQAQSQVVAMSQMFNRLLQKVSEDKLESRRLTSVLQSRMSAAENRMNQLMTMQSMELKNTKDTIANITTEVTSQNHTQNNPAGFD